MKFIPGHGIESISLVRESVCVCGSSFGCYDDDDAADTTSYALRVKLNTCRSTHSIESITAFFACCIVQFNYTAKRVAVADGSVIFIALPTAYTLYSISTFPKKWKLTFCRFRYTPQPSPNRFFSSEQEQSIFECVEHGPFCERE